MAAVSMVTNIFRLGLRIVKLRLFMVTCMDFTLKVQWERKIMMGKFNTQING